ncbi:Obp56c [Drosophila busckii]|uniref:Obp56c n=1 Tax=Drosophila busckii TaxID=30019 RepID=A0A0M5J0H8_DROBS|nr:uncharacterized protein LOC108594966 [Drosophila busckii]ALC42761.1 Obp56c [Drosophila busckii]
MYNKLLLVSLLLSLCCQRAWTRTVSVSLNMSLTRSELEDRNVSIAPMLSQEMILVCMQETQVSMSQLKLFRLSLYLNENSNAANDVAPEAGDGNDELSTTNSLADMDYINMAQQPRLEPLHCFVRCLHERLGLAIEDNMQAKVQTLLNKQKLEQQQCTLKQLESSNHCEAAYKLHLCYNYLKNLEAEQRIKEVLERSENNMAENDELLEDEEAKEAENLDAN